MAAAAARPSVRPRTTPHRRLIIPAALAVLAVLALAGCGGSGHHSQSSSAGGPADRAGTADGAAVAPSAKQPQGSATGSGGGPAQPLQQRAVVRTASIAVTVNDVDRAATNALAAAAAAGGRADQDDRSDDGSARRAELVLRVPPAKLDSLIDTVSRLGHEDSRSVQGQDVTASQADVTARVQALTISVGRLQDFLRHSGNISELVSLESQLTQRESDLRSTVAQQQALSDQLDLASLTVQLSSATRAAGTAGSSPAGFGAAVLHAMHGLLLTLRWAAAVLGYLLPFLLALALLAVPAMLWWRRRAGRARPVPSPEPATE
jgi:hypothetical protein